jgi:hypothetical protein
VKINGVTHYLWRAADQTVFHRMVLLAMKIAAISGAGLLDQRATTVNQVSRNRRATPPDRL